jgi:hypothetical protein
MPAPNSAPVPNASMRELQSTLMGVLNGLHESLDNVTDANVAQAIVREMQEVNHRLALVGGLLFAAQSKELDGKVAAVRNATTKVNATIAKFKNLAALLGAVSDFLGLVDQVIDLAKLL